MSWRCAVGRVLKRNLSAYASCKSVTNRLFVSFKGPWSIYRSGSRSSGAFCRSLVSNPPQQLADFSSQLIFDHDESLLNGGREWECSVLGFKLRGLEWGDPSCSEKVLCLHGYMDNAMSFTTLAPTLLKRNLHVIAIEFPGHGRSDRFPTFTGTYRADDYVRIVASLIHRLNPVHLTLMGHSMGAGISSVVAATFPDKVHRLILLEGLGVVTSAPENIIRNLKKHCDDIEKLSARQPTPYPSLDAAIRRLMKTHTGALTYADARRLAMRGCARLPPSHHHSSALTPYSSNQQDAAYDTRSDETAAHHHDNTSSILPSISSTADNAASNNGNAGARSSPSSLTGGGGGGGGSGGGGGEPAAANVESSSWVFVHDPLLRVGTAFLLTEEHMQHLLRAVRCPTLLLSAAHGYPWPREVFERRAVALAAGVADRAAAAAGAGGLVRVTVEGTHHVHMSDSDKVVPHVTAFLDAHPAAAAAAANTTTATSATGAAANTTGGGAAGGVTTTAAASAGVAGAASGARAAAAA